MSTKPDKATVRVEIVESIVSALDAAENVAAYIEEDEVMEAIAEALQNAHAVRDDPKRHTEEIELAVSQVQAALAKAQARLGAQRSSSAGTEEPAG
ncbi:hypothetical protein [Tianweitania sp.]|uniref:hypothetical protein n=1 Tax=Tianweitania sp. TaxID=2021634 RepID=UPI0028A18474|nr:hypothetical protein [Tianweitania sp.]